MNRKGFTLIELLTILVILGIIFGITVVSLNIDFGKAKGKAEEIFVETIEDAMDMYLDSSDVKTLNFSSIPVSCLSKTHGKVNLYKSNTSITMVNVFNSEFKPIIESELVNPNNKDVKCNSNVNINVYRDEDYIYYYEIDRTGLKCLTLDLGKKITNLPSSITGRGC